MTLIYRNHAESRLQFAVSPSATALQLLPNDGNRFPEFNNSGEWFPLHLIRLPTVDNAGQVTNVGYVEIVRVVGRNGDILQIERNQEGTEPNEFAAGDVVSLRLTAAAIDTFAKSGSRDFTVLRGLNYGVASGSVNDVTVNVSGLSQYSSSLQVQFKPIGPNTGAATIDVSTIGKTDIRLPGGSALHSGAIDGETIVDLRYDLTEGYFVLQNAAPATAGIDVAGLAIRGTETLHDVTGDNLKFTTQRTVSKIVEDFARGQTSRELPVMWSNVGDGSAGDLNLGSGQSAEADTTRSNRYASVTLGANAELSSSKDGVMIIRCSGTFNSSGILRVPRASSVYPVPCVGPLGGPHPSAPDARVAWPAQLSPFESADTAVPGRKLAIDELRTSILSGHPMQGFHGGSGSVYSNDGQFTRFPTPASGGIIIIADKIIFNGSARV